MHDVAYAHYYPLSLGIAKQVRKIRAEFFESDHPPAGSLLSSRACPRWTPVSRWTSWRPRNSAAFTPRESLQRIEARRHPRRVQRGGDVTSQTNSNAPSAGQRECGTEWSSRSSAC